MHTKYQLRSIFPSRINIMAYVRRCMISEDIANEEINAYLEAAQKCDFNELINLSAAVILRLNSN